MEQKFLASIIRVILKRPNGLDILQEINTLPLNEEEKTLLRLGIIRAMDHNDREVR